MITRRELKHALKLLEADLLTHVVTLKMLQHYSASMSMRIAEGAGGWALFSCLPVTASEWDRRAYPTAEAVVFIDGTDTQAKQSILDELHPGVFVFKTGDPELKGRLDENPLARKVNAYHSFTREGAVAAVSGDSEILRSSRLDEEVARLFERNEYEPEELKKYFSDGAEWFGLKQEGHIASVCFVYRNYARVWEIAGVYTIPEYRGRGLAKKTVAAALASLNRRRLIPRYQVRWDNTASINLAKASGLVEFLRVSHYLIDSRDKPRDRGVWLLSTEKG